MKPGLIFSVNVGDNPYEDLHRQDNMIDFLVEHGYKFSLGAEIYKGKITPMFFLHGMRNPYNILPSWGVTRILAVDREGNVWVTLDLAEYGIGKLTEIPSADINKYEWVLYEHSPEQYYTAIVE